MIQPTPGPSSSTRAPSVGSGVGEEQLEEGVAPVGGPCGELLERHAVVNSLVQAPRGCSDAPTPACSPPNPSDSSIFEPASVAACEPAGAIRANCAVRIRASMHARGERTVGAAIGLVARSARRARAHRGAARPRVASRPRRPPLLHVFVDDGLPEVRDRPRRGVRPGLRRRSRRGSGRSARPTSRSRRFDGPTAFSDYDGRVRNVGYRIPDLHSHSAHALDLYLHPKMFRMVELDLRPARDLVPVAVLRVRIAAGAAPRPDVRRHRPAVAPAGVVGRARRHPPRERPARVRADVAPPAVVRVRARTRWCAGRRSRPEKRERVRGMERARRSGTAGST